MTKRIAAFAMAAALVALYGCAGDSGDSSGSGGGGGGGGGSGGPATQIVVVQQPAGATNGNQFITQPRVELRDASGLLAVGDSATQVAVTLSGGTGGAVLSGTKTRTAYQGVVTFLDLSIDLAGTGYTLDFAATGLAGDSSSPFDVTTASTGGGSAPFVPAPPSGTATYYVDDGTSASDSNNGTSPSLPWRTLQHAAGIVQAGDIVDVGDGSYSRFTISSVTGTSSMPVVFRATGNAAVIDSGTSASASPDERDAIKVYDCHYVIIHGLHTDSAYRAGCRVTESFNVTIQGCVFADGGTWGLFTDYSDDLVLEGNECYGSVNEHGIYFSNSGDRAQIRGNYCHDNNASGIQINADPAQQNASFGTRGDGICEDSVIENNLCEHNGVAGAAALNFASIRNCDIRNNLLINNYDQTGIALWDDGYSPSYGSMNNRIYHNTVYFNGAQGRFCLSMLNGSTGNVSRNNIFIGGARGAITWSSDSLSGFDSDYDICISQAGWNLFENDTTGASYNLGQFQSLLGGAAHDTDQAPTFNGGMDFSLASGSVGRDDGDNTLGVNVAYDGATRPLGAGYDRGCFEK